MSDEEPSKSARKRDAQRLKALGQQLAELNDEQRAALPLPEVLAKALTDHRRITAHEAKRRQGQFIGRLMRKIDVAELEGALDDLTRTSAQARFAHHRIERWRDELIAADSALTAYIEAYPATDLPRLRALIRAARSRTVDPSASRALFRHLRENAARHGADPVDASVPPTVS